MKSTKDYLPKEIKVKGISWKHIRLLIMFVYRESADIAEVDSGK